jgi:hypothetical protein
VNSASDVLVVDPWRKDANGDALVTTLKDAIVHHGGATYFDIALSGSSR